MSPQSFPSDDRQVEALLAGRGSAADGPLLAVLGELRALGRVAAPAPSPALAHLLQTGLGVAPATVARRPAGLTRRRGLRGALLAVLAAGSVTCAATAANALPGEAQRATAAFLNAVTPFHFPSSRRVGPAGGPRDGAVPASGAPRPPRPATADPDGPADRSGDATPFAGTSPAGTEPDTSRSSSDGSSPGPARTGIDPDEPGQPARSGAATAGPQNGDEAPAAPQSAAQQSGAAPRPTAAPPPGEPGDTSAASPPSAGPQEPAASPSVTGSTGSGRSGSETP